MQDTLSAIFSRLLSIRLPSVHPDELTGHDLTEQLQRNKALNRNVKCYSFRLHCRKIQFHLFVAFNFFPLLMMRMRGVNISDMYTYVYKIVL